MQSAHRAGYEVICVDGFADLDTQEVCLQCWRLPLQAGRFVDAKLAACLSRLHTSYPRAKVILGAGGEYKAAWIEAQTGWSLCGCEAGVVNAVTDPQVFFEGLDQLNVNYPPVEFNHVPPGSAWLYKSVGACGGAGIRRQDGRQNLNRPGYWQREIKGQAISVLCIADHGSVQVIGFNRQYACADFEVFPYIYKGLIANIDLERKSKDLIIHYVTLITNHFKLIGIFSVDLIIQAGAVFVLEVNPRVSASYEFYERIYSLLNLVDAHIRVCEGERFLKICPGPRFSHLKCGYFIVYARKDCIVPRRLDWPPWAKDKPGPLTAIACSQPVCSVHACAAWDEHVYDRLVVYEKEIISILNL